MIWLFQHYSFFVNMKPPINVRDNRVRIARFLGEHNSNSYPWRIRMYAKRMVCHLPSTKTPNDSIYIPYIRILWVMYISLESIQLINGTFFSPTRNFFHQKLGEKPNPNHGPFPFLCPTRDDLIAPKCLMIEYMVVDISHINLRSSTSGNAFHKNPRETKV